MDLAQARERSKRAFRTLGVAPWWVLLFAFVLAGVTLLYGYKIAIKTDYTDWSVYHRAATRALSGAWEQVYTLSDGASPFRYAPPVLLGLLPLGLLSPLASKLTWYAVQWLGYAAGFFLIYRSLLRAQVPRPRAVGATFLSFVMILRFILDSFTIGQISGVMFFGFALGFWGIASLRAYGLALGVVIPGIIKVGPFVVLLSLLGVSARVTLRVGMGILFLVVSLCSIAWIILPESLWENWQLIVAMDSIYYDASHYGSQSLNSALLRATQHEWISRWLSLERAQVLRGIVTLGGLGGLALLFVSRPASTPQARVTAYALSVLPFLWFMPETFKYALTVLAFGFAVLWSVPKRSVFESSVLLLSVMTLSLAGKDLLPDALFFGLQRSSVPFLMTVIWGIALALRYRRETRGVDSASLLHALPPLPPLTPAPESVPLREGAWPIACLSVNVEDVSPERVREVWSDASHRGFDVRLAPYGSHPLPSRSAALRAQLLECLDDPTWKVVTILNAEQWILGDFFARANHALTNDSGLGLVRADRRHPETRFRVPVPTLPWVQGRHRLGVIFSRVLRIFGVTRPSGDSISGISGNDTHSGTAVLTRTLARALASHPVHSEFLWDAEWSRLARALGLKELGLPVTLALAHEKSLFRILKEVYCIILGLLPWRQSPRLRSSSSRSSRSISEPLKHAEVCADDWGMTPSINDSILDLARRGVIKRVSILTQSRHVSYRLDELLALQATHAVHFTLHWDLTYGTSRPKALLPVHSPAKLFFKWMSARATLRPAVLNALEAQLKAAKDLGIPLTGLDGHQHVHLLPNLLQDIAPLLRAHGIQRVRIPSDQALFFSPRLPVLILARLARHEAQRLGFISAPFWYPTPEQLGDPTVCAREIHRRRSLNPNAPFVEVIVHPALSADAEYKEADDDYNEMRCVEYTHLRLWEQWIHA